MQTCILNEANSECERLRTCEHKFDTPGQTISRLKHKQCSTAAAYT